MPSLQRVTMENLKRVCQGILDKLVAAEHRDWGDLHVVDVEYVESLSDPNAAYRILIEEGDCYMFDQFMQEQLATWFPNVNIQVKTEW